MISIIVSPIAKLVLYIATNKRNAMRIKLPKPVSNKVTKRVGTKNKINHEKINNVNAPTNKLIFLRENRSFNNVVIYIL